MQEDNDKVLKNLVRSMRANLKSEHGIDVPYTALRASFLQAQGLHPHAQHRTAATVDAPDRQELLALVKEAPLYFHPGYDFDGDKLRWLQRAGIVPSEAAPKSRAPTEVHALFLVPDEHGEFTRLALDVGGEFWLPANWRFERAARLVRQEVTAVKADVAARGLRNSCLQPEKFFSESWGLTVDTKRYHVSVNYLVPESDDAPQNMLLVQLSNGEWVRLLQAVLRSDKAGTAYNQLAEWVGQNYLKNLDAESRESQALWFARFVGCHESAAVPRTAQVTFQWLWPDQESEDRPAVMDLETGSVTVHGDVPEDTPAFEVLTRVVLPGRHDHPYEAWPLFDNTTQYWEVYPNMLPEIRKILRKVHS